MPGIEYKVIFNKSQEGVQHLFERNIKLRSSRLTAVQSSFEEAKEFMEAGQHSFRMESSEYHVVYDYAIL